MRTILIAAALLIAALAPPAFAQDGAEDILDKVINAPPPTADRVDGSSGKVRSDPSVQGGKALRVQVPGKSEQTWTVSVSNPITKPVKAGDTLVLAFWARLEKGEKGATTASLPTTAKVGEKSQSNPVTASSRAVISPIRRISSGFRVAPRPIFCGKMVAPTMLAWPWTASIPQMSGIFSPAYSPCCEASQ